MKTQFYMLIIIHKIKKLELLNIITLFCDIVIAYSSILPSQNQTPKF